MVDRLKQGGGGILHMLVSVRHHPKIVQWPPISLSLKSLGLDIYQTTPPSATRAVVQKLKSYNTDGGHLGFLQKGLLNAKITSEMQFLCQN